MPGEHFIHRAVLPTWLAVAACVLLLTGRTLAQSPDEHASHHPGGAPAGGMSANAGAPGMAGMGAPSGAGPSAGAGGMMGRGPGGGMRRE